MEKKQLINIAVWSGVSIIGVIGLAIGVKAVKNRIESSKGKGVGSQLNRENPVGKTLLIGEQGSVNFRKTPEVLTCSWYDFGCEGNLIDNITSNPVGVVKSMVTGKDGLIWYQVNRKGKTSGKTWSGYVREDVVKVQY